MDLIKLGVLCLKVESVFWRCKNMYMKFKDGKSKALTLSYDDGSIYDKRLVEILDKFGIKATFNIQSSDFYPEDGEKDGQWKMKLSEVKELFKNGNHELAIHGYHHPFFSLLKSERVLTEVLDDRRKLESELGIIVRGMAYAFGSYSDEVVDCLKKCGVCYSRTVNSTENFSMPEEWLKWHPTFHPNTPKLIHLPKEIIETILKLYKDKTELKGVEGKETEYLHSKELLNSIYGMCVTSIVHDCVTFGADGWETQPNKLTDELNI